jgi:hypothetical protein
MEKYLVAFNLLLFVSISSYGQRIQYSKATFHIDNPTEAQLISNVDGYHHVVTFTYNRKPVVHVFDDHLRLVESKQMDFTIRKDCDIRILSFADYYFVSMHIVKPSIYEIWKVDKDGNSVRFSDRFKPLMDTFHKHHFPELQLMTVKGTLYALGQTYYDTVKSIRCLVVRLDSNFVPQERFDVLYPFDRETDFLQQISLTTGALFVLKSARGGTGNSLSIMKVDLANGDVVTTSFNTQFQVNMNPGFAISGRDSSVLIYSTLSQTDVDRHLQRSVFISRLDRELKECTPIALLKHQFSQNTVANFLCIEGQPSLWLNLYTNRRLRGVSYNVPNPILAARRTGSPGVSYNYIDYVNYSGAMGVRFTVVDKDFKQKSDSLVGNDKKLVEVQSLPFGQFCINNKSYLVLVQNLTSKRKGLLMLGSDNESQLSATPLPVFDRYDFLLSELQSFGNYFIVPYCFKNEMGLMRVTVKQNSHEF